MIATPEFKVGILVVVVSALIGGMSLKVAESPNLLSRSKKYWFEVDDAGGLVKNSAVKMAGIKVGVIDDIKLSDGRARVHVMVDKDVPITSSAQVELRADGILGDKHVELIPGKVGDSPLETGEISSVANKASLDKVMEQIGDIASSLKEVSEVIADAAKEGNKQTAIGRIVLNIEKLTEDLANITDGNKNKINVIIDQVHGITQTLDELINDDSPEGFRTAWSSAVEGLKNFDKTLQNTREITDKLNSGEGTLGKLINDDDTADNLNNTMESINAFLGGIGSMEMSIDFRNEFLTTVDQSKSFFNVRIQPGLDRYYELGIVDSPTGVTTVVDSTVNDGPTTTTTTTNRNKTKFNLLFAKNFWDFTIKGGLIESAGGVGVDYFMFDKKLRLSIESFDFQDLKLRAFFRYQVLRGIYIVGGGDELADSDRRSAFIGAGVFITNDDLRTLAAAISL